MSTPVETFCKGMHQYQKHLFGTFDYRCRRLKLRTPQFFHTEWHRRARKTTAMVNLLIKEACRVPKSKYVYVAPTQVQARNIVWDDPNMIHAYLPDKREMDWKMNEQKMLITFENKSMLKFGGSDEPDSIRGIDAIGVGFDEWSLIKYTTWTEIFRPILAGKLHPSLDMIDVFRWAMFSYTPKGINHATYMFDSACCLGDGGVLPNCGEAVKMAANTYASRLDGELSGILSQSELNRMKDEVARGEIPQAFYDQETKCCRVTKEEMTLITSEMIHKLNEYHAHTTLSYKETRKIVSIDPAWGGDVCKIMGIVNNTVKKEKSINDKLRSSEVITAAKLVAQDIGTKNFIIDTVNDVSIFEGLSGDVAGYNVQEFKSSHKATENKDTQHAIRCANRRAEAYLYASQQIAKFLCGPIKRDELRRQLTVASRYTTQVGSGRMIIIPKLKIKEDLGCSPDEADTYIMGVWGSQHVQPELDGEIITVGAMADMVPDYRGY